MKNALLTTFEYTTEGGRAAVEALGWMLPGVEDSLAYVVLRRIMEKMKGDMETHHETLEQEAKDALPPPPTIREERDL